MAFPGPVPTPPNSGNPGTFNDDADAFLGWMALFATWLDEEGYPDFHNTITTESGSASAPSHSFSDDDDTGMYRPAANQIGFATGGSRRLLVTSNAIQPETNLRGVDGNAGAPGISFSSDTDTGILRPGSDQIGFATDGTQRLLLSTTALTSTLPFVAPSGSAAAPAVTFSGDTDTGIYSSGSDALCFATGGSRRGVFTTGSFQTDVPILAPDGTNGAPGISFASDTNTGLYRIGENQLGITAFGSLRLTVSDTAVTSVMPIRFPAGSASAPGLAFDGDTDTGMYRVGTNQIGLATGGTRRVLLSTTAMQVDVPLTGDCITGTVSQSGGNSTGAIFERGSNANGSYTRFADGTQICTRFVETSASADSTWTYPVAFSTALACVGSAFATGSITVITGGMNATSCVINAYNSSGTRVAAGTRLIAIGRWY